MANSTMSAGPHWARPVIDRQNRFAFSICTLVTKFDEYRAMIESFAAGGFTNSDCEFLYVDNSRGNILDCFAAYNRFLTDARGQYIILCHQDILLLDDNRETLDARLTELDRVDPRWALCGNAGVTPSGRRRIRITDRYGEDQRFGNFPAEVASLDENFIIARREANLALSRDLSGYHWYGADLCFIADILGWKSYVIDFHLRHKGDGKVDRDFFQLQHALEWKYVRAFRTRRPMTTVSAVLLGAGRLPLALLQLQRRMRGRLRAKGTS